MNNEQRAAALVALAYAGVPADMQEFLLKNNALDKAVEAALSAAEPVAWIAYDNRPGMKPIFFDSRAGASDRSDTVKAVYTASPASPIAVKALQKIAELKTSHEIGATALVVNDIEGSHDAMILEARSALSAQVQDAAILDEGHALAARYSRLHRVCMSILWDDLGKPSMDHPQTKEAMLELAQIMLMDALIAAASAAKQENA